MSIIAWVSIDLQILNTELFGIKLATISKIHPQTIGYNSGG